MRANCRRAGDSERDLSWTCRGGHRDAVVRLVCDGGVGQGSRVERAVDATEHQLARPLRATEAFRRLHQGSAYQLGPAQNTRVASYYADTILRGHAGPREEYTSVRAVATCVVALPRTRPLTAVEPPS